MSENSDIEKVVMSYYTHIVICWEGGHVLGYADSKKIMETANKYVNRYENYEKEFDSLLEQERQEELRKEGRTEDDYKKHRELSDRTVSQAKEIECITSLLKIK